MCPFGDFERNISQHNFTNFTDMPCGGCECVVEGSCMHGCCVGGRIREISAVHGGGDSEHEVKHSRRCRAPIVGVTAVRP